MNDVVSKRSFLYCMMASGLFLTFCNDGDNGTNPPDVTTAAESNGAMTVTVNCNDSTIAVSGQYYSGPTPQSTVWDVDMSDGEMKLLVPRKFNCDPECVSGVTACVEGDTCMSYPDPVDAGTITLTGLTSTTGGTTQTMKAVGLRKYYSSVDEFVFPPFAEGAALTVSSTGSASQPAFSMNLAGIKPIKVLNESINLAAGQPINLQWEPPTAGGNTKIHILIDITYHGGTKAKIEGETADDGALTISAAILDKLQTFGLSGFPRIDVVRRTEVIDETTKAKFSVESTISYELLIDGFRSCNSFDDCPAGMGFTACSIDRKCQ